MKSSNENLIVKLSAFVSDYYKDRLIKGLVFGVVLIGITGLIILFGEFFFHFNSLIRSILFYGFWLLCLVVFGFYVIVPLLALLNIGARISSEEAAREIGKKIDGVEDKLLNSLQLKEFLENDLARASIELADVRLTSFDFGKAIDRKWVRRAATLTILFVLSYTVTSLIKPEIISQGSKRIVEYDVAHHLVPPFGVDVDYNNEVRRGEALYIEVVLSGDELPLSVEVVHEDVSYLAKREKNVFIKQVSNLQRAGSFSIQLGKYVVGPFEYKVISNPELQSGKVRFNYPPHTSLVNEEIGLEDVITVPEGTNVEWNFTMVDVSEGFLVVDSSIAVKSNKWSKSVVADSSFQYSLIGEGDTLLDRYALNVVKDSYPSVTMNVEEDAASSMLFLNGLAIDDYGLRSAVVVIKSKNTNALLHQLNIGSSNEEFYRYVVDTKSLNDVTEIYVEVRDNDAINGYKTSRSQSYLYTPKSKDEVLEESLSSRADNTSSLEELTENISEIRDAFEKSRKEKALSESDDWSKKQEQQSLKETYKELDKKVSDLSNKMEDDRLNKAKELLKDIEELLERLDKKDDHADQLEMTLEDLEEELKSNLELYKQMAFELGVEEALDRLDDLAAEEESLADSSMSAVDRALEQDSLNSSFDKLMDNLEELKQDQKELKSSPDVDLDPKELDEAGKDMDSASEKANSGKSSESQQSQNSAAEKMNEASKKMRKSLMDAREQQQQEDMETLRAIQENLLQLSFDQELIYQKQLITSINDPSYRAVTVNQKQVVDDFEVVKDSLNALGERVDQLRDKISKEVHTVDKGLAESVESMEARNKAVASQRQREGLTSMNNLALLLSEVLTQMQQQMAQSKFGDGACSKPGSGAKPKPSLSKMQAKQKALQEEMQKMKGDLEKGKSKGKKGESGKGSNGSSGDNAEQIAKMAAEQQAIREEVQRMAEEAARKGNGLSKDLKKLADEMEEVEKDILDRSIEAETIERQEEILARMLQTEDALREQDEDTQRQASAGVGEQEDLSRLKEYLKKRESEIELLRHNNINLQPYFKSKYARFVNDRAN